MKPSIQDIESRRRIVYIPTSEVGVVTSFNSHFVFVRFGAEQHSKACAPQDLIWEHTTKASEQPIAR